MKGKGMCSDCAEMLLVDNPNPKMKNKWKFCNYYESYCVSVSRNCLGSVSKKLFETPKQSFKEFNREHNPYYKKK